MDTKKVTDNVSCTFLFLHVAIHALSPRPRTKDIYKEKHIAGHLVTLSKLHTDTEQTINGTTKVSLLVLCLHMKVKNA